MLGSVSPWMHRHSQIGFACEGQSGCYAQAGDKVSMSTSWRPKTILFATDFLESSRLALDYAIAFAHHYQAKLLMVHVFHMSQAATEAELFLEGPSISRRSRESRLEALAGTVRRAGVEVEWRLVEGWMPEALLATAQQVKPDLLVLGTHGIYHGIGHMLIGSNAEAVLLSAPWPTLTIGRHVLAGIGLDISFENILYITDFMPESAVAAPYAMSLSREFGARLDVCQLISEAVATSPEAQIQATRQFRQSVERTLSRFDPSWCTPAYQLNQGAKAEQILQSTRADTSSLIVLGVKAEAHFARHLHTSLAYQLVARAVCPILTVRE